FSPEEINPILEKYQKLGFLNDRELTLRRMEVYKQRGYGPQWIAGKLRTQGLKASEYTEEEQREAIERVLKTPPFARKDRSKKIAALQRRGFDLDVIFQVVD
ncbi:MAG TPA: RecX family transcriptional regulator, partial [Candidatus Babeliaceae bacterium]|nr:RecX family transcriptional regulator [Candidatus Babeliaceae bacterium]